MRTSSFGASDFKRGSTARSSAGNHKMAELNLPKGHSPHFSPSRVQGNVQVHTFQSEFVRCLVN